MPDTLDGLSMDLERANLDKLRAAFPECFAEGKLDIDKLLGLCGEYIDNDFEKYRFEWKGKAECLRLAQKRSAGTLRPCPEESVNWDSTRNLYIEGDNLEVLKLLQSAYYRKVKMIYIDPPYNTGNDFVYADDFADPLARYKEVTAQTTKSNPETMGRFHTNWLNMMYPRLRLAANLLRDDGVIFISIDDNEVDNLKRLCNEVFGEENFVANIVWKARVKPINIGDAKYRPQKEIEYILCYEKNFTSNKFYPLITGSQRSYPYKLDERKYRLATILKSNRGINFRSTMSFELEGYTPPEGQRWQAGEAEIKRLWEDGHIEFKDGTPFRRYFEDEEGAEHSPFYCFMNNEWSSTSEAGKSELNAILGEFHGFDTVKPITLLRTLIMSCTNDDDIIFDFFSGSATTAHAVMQLNSEMQTNRKFILVQIPEKCTDSNKIDNKTVSNICEIGKERIRRAGAQIAAGDTGFRVFKLDTSNLKTWDAAPIDPQAGDVIGELANRMNAMIHRVKPDRSDLDMVFEVMLKLGVPPTYAVTAVDINGKTAYSVGEDCLLLVCLAPDVQPEDVERMAEYAPAKAIISRDSFADDTAMANAYYILRDRGVELKLV